MMIGLWPRPGELARPHPPWGYTLGLRELDLNLLPVFEAIYLERNLTRASETLHMTQPAVSNALARMRVHFADPLFVRAGRGVAPTSQAEALIGPVREALTRLRVGLLRVGEFIPDRSERVFNIAARDTGMAVLLPRLAGELERQAPGVCLRWHQLERTAIPVELASGRLDFALDVPHVAQLRGGELEHVPLLREAHVCVMRRGHPAARRKLDLPRWLGLRHITVSSRRVGRSLVEQAARKQGHTLRSCLRLPHYLPAFQTVLASDCVLTAPQALALAHEVIRKPLPLPVPPLSLHLYFRSDAGQDPALAWLRGLLQRLAAERPTRPTTA